MWCKQSRDSCKIVIQAKWFISAESSPSHPAERRLVHACLSNLWTSCPPTHSGPDRLYCGFSFEFSLSLENVFTLLLWHRVWACAVWPLNSCKNDASRILLLEILSHLCLIPASTLSFKHASSRTLLSARMTSSLILSTRLFPNSSVSHYFHNNSWARDFKGVWLVSMSRFEFWWLQEWLIDTFLSGPSVSQSTHNNRWIQDFRDDSGSKAYIVPNLGSCKYGFDLSIRVLRDRVSANFLIVNREIEVLKAILANKRASFRTLVAAEMVSFCRYVSCEIECQSFIHDNSWARDSKGDSG